MTRLVGVDDGEDHQVVVGVEEHRAQEVGVTENGGDAAIEAIVPDPLEIFRRQNTTTILGYGAHGQEPVPQRTLGL